MRRSPDLHQPGGLHQPGLEKLQNTFFSFTAYFKKQLDRCHRDNRGSCSPGLLSEQTDAVILDSNTQTQKHRTETHIWNI